MSASRNRTARICFIGLMAAVAFVSNYISIPFGASRFHIGNSVCVLGGLLLGPVGGLLAAAIGNGLFDIVGGYGAEFIITAINKGAIALVAGLIAYKAGHKDKMTGVDSAKIIIGSVLGALTYTMLYLIKSYFTARFVQGLSPADSIAVDGTVIKGITTIMTTKAIASLTNAVFAFVTAPILFFALRPALRHADLFDKL